MVKNLHGFKNGLLLGEFAEFQAISTFLKEGLPVLKPIGNFHRFDLIVLVGKKHIKIQVKMGHVVGARIRFKNFTKPGKTSKKHAYTKKDIDFFMVYFLDENKFYVVPVEAKISGLRIKYTKWGPKIFHDAKDFEFSKWVKKIKKKYLPSGSIK